MATAVVKLVLGIVAWLVIATALSALLALPFILAAITAILPMSVVLWALVSWNIDDKQLHHLASQLNSQASHFIGKRVKAHTDPEWLTSLEQQVHWLEEFAASNAALRHSQGFSDICNIITNGRGTLGLLRRNSATHNVQPMAYELSQLLDSVQKSWRTYTILLIDQSAESQKQCWQYEHQLLPQQRKKINAIHHQVLLPTLIQMETEMDMADLELESQPPKVAIEQPVDLTHLHQ